jgi:hypothetical protein
LQYTGRDGSGSNGTVERAPQLEQTISCPPLGCALEWLATRGSAAAMRRSPKPALGDCGRDGMTTGSTRRSALLTNGRRSCRDGDATCACGWGW